MTGELEGIVQTKIKHFKDNKKLFLSTLFKKYFLWLTKKLIQFHNPKSCKTNKYHKAVKKSTCKIISQEKTLFYQNFKHFHLFLCLSGL